MTTKGLSYKQVIVSMKNVNTNSFIKDLSIYIFNISRTLKNIKSSTMVDYICIDSKGIIITTNNITILSDLQAIKKYIKSMLTIDVDQVQFPRLPQSKSYLKIIGVLYLSEATDMYITLDKVKRILKNNHIFNDVVLVLKLRIVKVSPKSDIAIIWINIWDAQSSSKAKILINQWFNIKRFITTIQDANMNPDIL